MLVLFLSAGTENLRAEGLIPERNKGFSVSNYLRIWDTFNFYTVHPRDKTVDNFNLQDNKFKTHWTMGFHGWVTNIFYLDFELLLLESQMDLFRSEVAYPSNSLSFKKGLEGFWPSFYEPLTKFNVGNVLTRRIKLDVVMPFFGLSLYKGTVDTDDKQSYIYRTIYGENHENKGTFELYSANKKAEKKSYYSLGDNLYFSWLYALTRRNGTYGMYAYADTIINDDILIGASYANEASGTLSNAELAEAYRNSKALKQMGSLGYRHKINDVVTLKTQVLGNIYGSSYTQSKSHVLENIALSSNIKLDYKLFEFFFQAGITGLNADTIFGRKADGTGDESLGDKGSLNFKLDGWVNNLFGFDFGFLNALSVYSLRDSWVNKHANQRFKLSTSPYVELTMEEFLPFPGAIGVYPHFSLEDSRNKSPVAKFTGIEIIAKQNFTPLLSSFGMDTLQYVKFTNSTNGNVPVFEEAGVNVRFGGLGRILTAIELTYSLGVDYKTEPDGIENFFLINWRFFKGLSLITGVKKDDKVGFNAALVWDAPVKRGTVHVFVKFNYNLNPWELEEKAVLNFRKVKFRSNSTFETLLPVLKNGTSAGNGKGSLTLGVFWELK